MSPIPSLIEASISGWPLIVDCDEPLVDVAGPRLVTDPVYARLQLEGASEQMLIRTGALARLNQAAEALPEGLGFLVLDTFRPLIVQQALWDWQERNVRAEHPHLSDEAVIDIVRHFVAFPTSDPLQPTPHRTGGAVDLTIIHLETGEELDMGTAFDEAIPRARTDWFEENPSSPVTENRRLLYTAMFHAGFANYPNEWWHYEFGTRRWAGHTQAPQALYGGR